MPKQPAIHDANATPGGRPRHPARALRNYLIAGLLIWMPIIVTVWVVRFLSGILDQSIVLLPPSWRPEAAVRPLHPGPRHRARRCWSCC